MPSCFCSPCLSWRRSLQWTQSRFAALPTVRRAMPLPPSCGLCFPTVPRRSRAETSRGWIPLLKLEVARPRYAFAWFARTRRSSLTVAWSWRVVATTLRIHSPPFWPPGEPGLRPRSRRRGHLCKRLRPRTMVGWWRGGWSLRPRRGCAWQSESAWDRRSWAGWRWASGGSGGVALGGVLTAPGNLELLAGRATSHWQVRLAGMMQASRQRSLDPGQINWRHTGAYVGLGWRSLGPRWSFAADAGP